MNNKIYKILLAEDDISFGRKISNLLQEKKMEVEWVTSYSHLLHSSRDFSSYDLLLLDLVLEDDGSVDNGLETIRIVKKRMPSLPILILTAHAATKSVSEAFKRGASDFFEKPFQFSREFFELNLIPAMLHTINNSIEKDWENIISILKSMKEDELIDNVILPFLRSIGFSSVRRIEHHGPGEFGRDILPFFKYDEFMQKIFYAIQVKTGDITARNINPILDQAKTALSVSFIDHYDNTRKRIDKAIIIFSGQLTPDASRILEDNLEVNSNIVFIDNSRLLELLRQNNLIHLIKSKYSNVDGVLIPCLLKSESKRLAEKEAVLKKLVPYVCDFAGIFPDLALRSFYKKEKTQSTGSNYRAFPHIYPDELKTNFIWVVCSNFPINWDSLDGKPVYLIWMFLHTKNSIGFRFQLKTLALCSRISNELGVYQKCVGREEKYLEEIVELLISILNKEGIKVKKEEFIHIDFPN